MTDKLPRSLPPTAPVFVGISNSLSHSQRARSLARSLRLTPARYTPRRPIVVRAEYISPALTGSDQLLRHLDRRTMKQFSRVCLTDLRRTSSTAMLRPMDSLPLRGIAKARGSPRSAAAPISSADEAWRVRWRKTSAFASRVRLSLCTLTPLSDGEPSLRRTPPLLREERHLRLCVDGAAIAVGAVDQRVQRGRGLPVGPLASLKTAEHSANPPAAAPGALRAHPAQDKRVPSPTPRFAGALRLIPSPVMVPGFGPNLRAGYVQDLIAINAILSKA